MKAAQINEYGGPSVVQLHDIEKPELRAGQVLVEVYAASLNPFDSKLREGMMQAMVPLQFPVTLGGDIAGVVTEVADDVTGVSVGDEVYGQAGVAGGGSGAFAEYAATIHAQIAEKPSSVSMNEAAALPLVGVSALQALSQHIRLEKAQKIFIHGGAGGIGSLAIQLAKHIGAYVATTATGDDIETVKQFGANEVIDYKAQDFSQILDGYDAVFDTVGGEDFERALTILKPGGIAVSMIAQADKSKVEELSVTAITQGTRVTTEMLDELRQFVDAGVLVPRIGATFPLEKIQDAFAAHESGQAKGKVVLTIK